MVETADLLFRIEPLQQALETGFQKTGRWNNPESKVGLVELRDGQRLKLIDSGAIVAQGRMDGQLLVLVPQVEGGKVT